MYGFLHGKIIFIDSNDSHLLINVGNVGYIVYVTQSMLYELSYNDSVSLYIVTHYRDNAIKLFGFKDVKDKQCFEMLCKVNGISGKLALNVISSICVDELMSIIREKREIALVKVPGIGKKVAHRVVSELHTIITNVDCPLFTFSNKKNDMQDDQNEKIEDTVEALISLGHSRNDAINAVQKALGDDDYGTVAVQDVIKKSLNILSNKE